MSADVIYYVVLFVLLSLPGALEGAVPVAKNVIQIAAPEADFEIQLLPYDSDGFSMNTTITTLPASGSLYQLSQVFSVYGYSPKRSTLISSANTLVSSISSNRVLFAAPLGFTRTQFTYSAVNVNGTSVGTGIVYITLADMVVQNSDFIENSEDWMVVSRASVAASWSATSTGSLNHFIYSDSIPLVVGLKNDLRWSFQSPAKFHSNYGHTYNGLLKFWLTSFAGDFTENVYPNPKTFVSITCESCASGAGITLAQRNITYVGDTRLFSFTLNEALLNEWKKDPQDITITEWTAPSACEFFEVLSNISSINIYPDVTSEYESVALDEVELVLGDGDVSISCY